MDLLAQLKICYDKCYTVAKSGNPDKHARKAFGDIKETFLETLSEEDREEKAFLLGKYTQVEKDAVRDVVLNEGIRLTVELQLISDLFGVKLTIYQVFMVLPYLRVEKHNLYQQL